MFFCIAAVSSLKINRKVDTPEKFLKRQETETDKIFASSRRESHIYLGVGVLVSDLATKNCETKKDKDSLTNSSDDDSNEDNYEKMLENQIKLKLKKLEDAGGNGNIKASAGNYKLESGVPGNYRKRSISNKNNFRFSCVGSLPMATIAEYDKTKKKSI